ncbi:MAG TPA: BatA domain-containing protein [Gemmatimonas sp.]|nr:BatA domain-containing protein [Gemmatimonas sp.]
MGFLAPALLGLAVLAGVPLLVHLLRRRVARTVDFPAVRYLTRMEQEHSQEMRLRHRLLLLLRILAVLALAFAAARPIARLAGIGHAPVAIAIVVDNSMSSGRVIDGRAVLDDLRGDARALLGDLGAGDRAWVVTADGRVTGGPISALLAAVDAIVPLGGRGDLGAATRRAAALTASGAPRARVVALVSDGQINSFASASDSAVALGEVPLVALLRPHGSLRNHAVVAAASEPARWTPTGNVTFAIAAPDSAAWRVTLDGRTVARGTAGAAPVSTPTRLAQRLGSSATGWVRGSVELDSDELRGDDVRWFAVRVAPPPTVAVRAEAGVFLSAALATLLEEKRLARGAEGSPGTVTVSGADAAGLRGPVLLAAPSDPVRVGEANRTLARLGIPWRFGAIARDLVLTRSDSALNEVPVRLRYPLMRSPGNAASAASDTLVMAGGAPWAVAGPDYVLVASPLEPDATDLPVRAGFVPWLLDVLSRRLGTDGMLIEAHPGQSLSGFASSTALERPDGSLLELSGDRLTVPNLPGVYYTRRDGVRTGALVVNPEPAESDLASSSDANGGMMARLSGRSISAETDAARWRTRVLDNAIGRTLIPPLVALALLLLLLEAWFSRERGASAADRPAKSRAKQVPSSRAA